MELLPKPTRLHKYASAVGSIGWACIATRPDFACAYGTLARYVANPGPEHFNAPLWTLAYIKGTLDHELVYSINPTDPDGNLHACSDSKADS